MSQRHLEGIVKLQGKWVILEEIENPKLRRVLHSRLSRHCFNFFGGSSNGYTETHDGESRHTESHRDNHTERHNDNLSNNHQDFNRTRHEDVPGGCRGRAGYEHLDEEKIVGHTDRNSSSGYSETIDRGYNEHTDHY